MYKLYGLPNHLSKGSLRLILHINLFHFWDLSLNYFTTYVKCKIKCKIITFATQNKTGVCGSSLKFAFLY